MDGLGPALLLPELEAAVHPVELLGGVGDFSSPESDN